MALPNLKSLNKSIGKYRAPSYDITFTVATAYTTDGNGNRVPSATKSVVIPCRLKKPVGSAQKVLTEAFPGTDTHQLLLNGWVNDDDNPTFPAELRAQRTPVGTVELDGVAGRIECKLSLVSQGAATVGERFTARFTAT